MAKIKDLKLEIAGVEYVIHINCNSKGIFSANIPQHIANPLKLDSRIETDNLGLIEKDINAAFTRYKDATITQEMFIWIQYASCGHYSAKENGDALFAPNRGPYRLDISFGSCRDGLGFSFGVCIKEMVDGVETLYEGKKGSSFAHWDEASERPDEWFKGSQLYARDGYKYVPFTEGSMAMLKQIREKIRSASEILFNLVSQEESALEATLLNQKALL